MSPQAPTTPEDMAKIMASLGNDPETFVKIMSGAGASKLPDPPTITEADRKSIVFRVVYFCARKIRRAAVLLKPAAYVITCGALAAAAVYGSYLLGGVLFGISPLLYWGFVAALAASLVTSIIAFAAKEVVAWQKSRLNKEQVAVL